MRKIGTIQSPDKRSWPLWIRGEWWWYVSRHFEPDNICRRIANMIPRRIALCVFVRVFAEGDTGPNHLDVYEKIYRAWNESPRSSPRRSDSPAR